MWQNLYGENNKTTHLLKVKLREFRTFTSGRKQTNLASSTMYNMVLPTQHKLESGKNYPNRTSGAQKKNQRNYMPTSTPQGIQYTKRRAP